MFDCIVVGTGPAGVSAALNLKIRNKSFMLIGNKELSDKISKAERIQNYPGFPDTSGVELKSHFRFHLQQMDIEIEDRMVNAIRKYGDSFGVMAGSEFYEAKSIILATGVVMQKPFKGEEDYVGKGVSYCATCDGSLYRGKKIAVFSSNKRFEHEVKYLADLAAEVEFFPNYIGASEIGENVHSHIEKVKEIRGEKRVSAFVTADNEYPVDGIFILRDSMSLSNLLPDLESEDGHIKVDRIMATSVPGVYACGDCTGKPYQYTKAVGEGNVAAHSVLDYLSETESK